MDNRNSIAWKIYYEDGSTYTGPPYEAPPLGVMIIVHADLEHGRFLRFNYDYYWYVEDKDQWEGSDLFGLYDYLMRPGPRKVIFGRITDNETFSSIHQKAYFDEDFLPKTAYSQRERIHER